VAAAPNSWNIECREIRTGQLIWRYQHPALRRVLGASGEHLIVVTAGELLALDAATGRVAWSRTLADPAYRADAARGTDPRRGLDVTPAVVMDEGGDILVIDSSGPDGGMRIRRVRGTDGRFLSPLEVEGVSNQPINYVRAFSDGQRLYRLGIGGERTEQYVLQVLESEE